MAACFAHVASRALNLDIDATLITGDPLQCPAFLAALLQIRAVAPDTMKIPQDKTFLTKAVLQEFKVCMEYNAAQLLAPNVRGILPRLQVHTPDADTSTCAFILIGPCAT